MAIQRVRPTFVATNIITGEDRSDRVVLEANLEHNTERKARLERAVFVNDITGEQALEAVCDREGVIDIVTELGVGDVARVEESEHAKLVTIEANRLLVGIFNTWPDIGAPLADRRAREAINCAVDRHRMVDDALGGHGQVLGAMTPPWEAGGSGAKPRQCDAERARQLLAEVDWPQDRPLRIATPGALEAIAAMIAADVEDALGIAAEVTVVASEGLAGGARMLIEKKLVPPWDVLVHAWFDLSSDLPPAVMHREFFGDDGAFRAGPPDPEFDRRFATLVREADPAAVQAAAREIDQYCFEESKALFLCAPHALYAVNRHVNFVAYKTTFELADSTVSEEHWSRRG